MADGSIVIDTRIDSDGAEKGVNRLGSKLGGLAKGALVGITAATVAVGGLVEATVEQYSQFEQLTGGVETLFKSSSNKVMDYADNAYKSAGMSANEYMSTITGFSASLLQGLGGDTAKAAEVGNTAVTDMSDNANKMGTSIENIQNAYQGFAKQNYTMLDNLKLGYGGTKTEMERLLADAEKVSGIHYDISNFSDVIEAIHIVQNEIGITGTTAKEASSTIEGSLNMTKSAWNNLLTNMAFDDADFDTLVGNLVDSVGALGENLLPRVEIALNGVGELISRLLPPIAGKIPELIMSLLPKMVEAGTNIISSLITGIQTNLPIIATGAVEIVSSLINALFTMLPQLLEMGMQLIVNLALGIAQALPTLIPLAIQCIMSLIDTIITNLPLILNAGLQLLQGLATGIINAIPILVEMLPLVIDSMINCITEALPMILESGLTILLALIDGIVQCIPQLIDMLPQIIDTILNFITQNLPQIIQMGIKVLLALINGLINALPQLINMLPNIINTIANTLLQHLPEIIRAGIQINIAIMKGLIQAIPQLITAIPQIVAAIFKAFASVNWMDIGINILAGIGKGIISGVKDMVGSAIRACKELKENIKNFFDINSPSRVMRDQVGKYLAQGIGVGFADETGSIKRDMQDSLAGLTAKMQATVDNETSNTGNRIVSSSKYDAMTDNSIPTNDIPEGSTFIIKNYMDSEEISEYTYKKTDGKFVMAGKRVR